MKHFVIKVLTAPLGEGRNVKIDNFARKLKVDRLERNIRGLFVKTRIRFSFQKLQTIDIAKANKLVMVFRNYVQRFRKRRFALKR